jgi:hypothetical protein
LQEGGGVSRNRIWEYILHLEAGKAGLSPTQPFCNS